MKTTSNTFKMAVAIICVLSMALALTGCGAQEYVFEAEYAIVADGSGMWTPNLEKESKTEDGDTVAGGICNVTDGSTVTWKIVSDKAEKATVTLNIGSYLKNWGSQPMGTIGVKDMTKAMTLAFNGTPIEITGSIPDGATMEIVAFEFEVDLVAGENVFVLTALGTSEEVNLFVDSLVIETGATLTFTETDNSDRIWQMA